MTVRVDGPMRDRYDEVLTDEALAFLADLHRRFDARRRELLAAARAALRRARRRRHARLPPRDQGRPRGRRPGGSPPGPGPGRPAGRDHRPDRPQDDDQRPQLRRPGLAGRPRGRQHPALGEHGRGSAQPARRHRPADRLHLAGGQDVRPRRRRSRPSWCARAAGTCRRSTSWSTASATSGSLTDFGLYFFHCAQPQLDDGLGPYFYLPKMESHLEARLWNDVFVHAQDALGIPQGTVRATVLIETYPGRLRDGGDPLRAARPLRRVERRPLGLHVLASSRSSAPAARSSCCPTATR